MCRSLAPEIMQACEHHALVCFDGSNVQYDYEMICLDLSKVVGRGSRHIKTRVSHLPENEHSNISDVLSHL